MQMQQSALTEGKIGSTLLRFAIPFMTSSLLQALYGAVDLFVVGRYDSSAAVSAVSIGSQLMHTITGIVLGISTGGTVLIGRAVGERDGEKAARAVGTLASLFACIAVLLTPVMMLCARGLTLLLETPPQAVEDAYAYILICSAGIPFIVGYNAVSGIFRGIGDSKTPMYFVAAACVINILLDFWLVGGLGMGAAGAAIATIVAQGGSLALSLLFIWRKGFPFPFERRHLRPDGASAQYSAGGQSNRFTGCACQRFVFGHHGDHQYGWAGGIRCSGRCG